MTGRATVVVAIVAAVLSIHCAASGRGSDAFTHSEAEQRVSGPYTGVSTIRDTDTLWIFDADFEDLQGDNAGWQTFDMTGFPPDDSDYWHKDTIRINGFEWLGDSTWWCGTYCSWWEYPRGYGNNWRQWLHRSIPLSSWSEPGDTVTFEWDQRYAMEKDYDYGYIDVSDDGGATWQTLETFCNYGFMETPGYSVDWDHPDYAHGEVDLSQYAGGDVRIRFRAESDGGWSSADEGANPPLNTIVDGMWQLDNFDLRVGGETVWFDDCEAPGENGWEHESVPCEGAVGLAFYRALNPETFRGFACGELSGWMIAAVDSVSGVFVQDQYEALVSPPIDVSGSDGVAVEWSGWVDTPAGSGESADLRLFESDTGTELSRAALGGTSYGWHDLTSEPAWRTVTLSHTMQRDWLAVAVFARHRSSSGTGPYTAGLFTDRLRVGITTPDDETRFLYHRRHWIEDTFGTSFSYGAINVTDTDGVASVRVIASPDSGTTWYSRSLTEYSWGCRLRLPDAVGVVPAEVRYYVEATDSLGHVSTCPADAPNVTYSVRRLPITGSTSDQGVLVVDKRMATLGSTGAHFDSREWEEVTNALDVLGYRYDLFRASENWSAINGPTDDKAYSHYDTHIWLTGNSNSSTLTSEDQSRLSDWLNSSTFAYPKRLILIGDDIGYEMVERGADQIGLFPTYLEAEYEERHPGGAYVGLPDTTIIIRDGGLGVMDHDDGQCALRCGCPVLGLLDVIGPADGGSAFPLLEYETSMTGLRHAGTFRVSMETGATTVIIPFDLKRMTEGATNDHTDALNDRVALLGNLLQLLGESPSGAGTDVIETTVFATALAAPHPNPFNPTATVSYTIGSPGRVTIRAYDLAGRIVRTLVDAPHDAGEFNVGWDGRTDAGDRAASGVYFIRMTTAGGDGAGYGSGIGAESRQQKLVLLK